MYYSVCVVPSLYSVLYPVAWVCLVCLLLCKEDGSYPVSAIIERRDMGLYEVPLSTSLLGFGWDNVSQLPYCNIGTWNVQNMYSISKTAQLIKEMGNYKLDILDKSECRWTGSGRMSTKSEICESYTMIYIQVNRIHIIWV